MLVLIRNRKYWPTSQNFGSVAPLYCWIFFFNCMQFILQRLICILYFGPSRSQIKFILLIIIFLNWVCGARLHIIFIIIQLLVIDFFSLCDSKWKFGKSHFIIFKDNWVFKRSSFYALLSINNIYWLVIWWSISVYGVIFLFIIWFIHGVLIQKRRSRPT